MLRIPQKFLIYLILRFSLNKNKLMASTTFLPTDINHANLTSSKDNNNMLMKRWQKLLTDLALPCTRLVAPLECASSTAAVNGQKMERENVLESINKIRSLATSVDTEMLRFQPVNPTKLWAMSFSAPVYEHTNLFEMSVFGLRFGGDSIPLHDHPNMFGFIRPLHGRIRISSLSWLEPEEERKLEEKRGNKAGGREQRPARYDGQIVLSGNCKEPPIAVVEPSTANLHTIEALEDGAAFFDLLVPGYGSNRTCTYYNISGEKDPTEIGQIVWLEGMPDAPKHFTMQELKLEPIQSQQK